MIIRIFGNPANNIQLFVKNHALREHEVQVSWS